MRLVPDFSRKKGTSAAHEADGIANGLGAYAAEQLVTMEGCLGHRSKQLHGNIHETRKALRRFRSVFALCGPADDRSASVLDQAARRLGKSLSKLRDAHVMVQFTAKRLAGYEVKATR